MKIRHTLYLSLVAALSVASANQALAADAPPDFPAPALQQQILEQGPMLRGNLHQAREAGLSSDALGMTYSLQQAQRLVEAMQEAQRLGGSKGSGDTAVPLGQTLELDRPESAGREQAVADFEVDTGSFDLAAVGKDIDTALAALKRQPPAMGEALDATNAALQKVQPKLSQ